MEQYSYRRAWGKIRSLNLKIGFVISFAFVFFAFQLHVEPKEVFIPEGPDIQNDLIVIPRTPPEKKVVVPPKVKKAVVIEKKTIISEFLIKETDEIDEDPLDDLWEEDIIDDLPAVPQNPPEVAPPVALYPVEELPDEVKDIVEIMPLFGDCSSIVDKAERYACSNLEVQKYVQSKVRYPSYAREIGIEGKVIAQFYIDKEGKLQDIKVVRGLEGGCNQEVLRVLNAMPDWKPGKMNYRPVNVRITIPVKFSLE